MNVTFLIGNGFDLRMGLKSSFRDFEKYYVTIAGNDPVIDTFKSNIADNMELWADFEKALGGYTNEFFIIEQDKFQRVLDDFSTHLIWYLEAEEKKAAAYIRDVDLEFELEEEMERSLHIFNENIFTEVSKKRLRLFRQRLKYRFISFNYTHVFDRCIGMFPFGNILFRDRYTFRDRHYKTIIKNNVTHVHGELPGPIITGVDNKSQIGQEEWAEDKVFQKKLIKPEISTRAGRTAGEEAMSILRDSDVICIFGMSIGETDLRWWEEIGKWLLEKGKKLYIQVYAKVNDFAELTHSKIFDIEDLTKDRFCLFAGYSPEECAIAKGKIVVLINPDMFNIRPEQLAGEDKKKWELLKKMGYEPQKPN